MILCDVGVLLSTMVEKAEHHRPCKAWVEELRRSGNRFAVSELILAAVVRIGSHPKVFRPTPSVRECFAFVEAFRSHPKAVRVEPGEGHWRIFHDLVRAAKVSGADTTDAYFAALAIEHGCQWWTLDRDFACYPGLDWRNLLEARHG